MMKNENRENMNLTEVRPLGDYRNLRNEQSWSLNTSLDPNIWIKPESATPEQ